MDSIRAVILDLDEGPTQLTRPENRVFYTDAGIGEIQRVLRPGGVLALWSSERETELLKEPA